MAASRSQAARSRLTRITAELKKAGFAVHKGVSRGTRTWSVVFSMRAGGSSEDSRYALDVFDDGRTHVDGLGKFHYDNVSQAIIRELNALARGVK